MIAYDRLSQIIPTDQALANKALTVALQQISGITNMGSLQALAQTVKGVNTNVGLPAINSQTQPLTNTNRSYLLNTVGKGTGPCGTITIEDCMGTLAGWVIAANLTATTNTLQSLGTGGLQGLYTECLNCMNDQYTVEVIYDPGPPIVYWYQVELPSGGTYGPYPTKAAAINDAIATGLIPKMQAAIAGLGGGAAGASMNANFNNICQQIGNEQDLQKRAGLDFANNFANLQANSQTAIFSFVMSLPGYGQDIQVGGKAQFLETIVNLGTQGGQAVVATMRQGRTDSAINATGVLSGSGIPLYPNPPPTAATLLPDTYTVQQAIAQVKI